ncbi:MAG: Hsp70 family protein [Lachnospiraceae bacterium]|nr:Hsp70 family protein [Lachnospiraceae bacterium]
MAIIGIDLGTTNSLACIYRDGRAELIPNELGDYKTSSAVSVLEDGTVLIGAAAKERLVSHPESTAASFKIWMGTKKIITLSNRRFQPEELSALVLRQLMEDAGRYLGEPVEEAVISVPAYFNDDQRCATKLAAQLAGLTVKRLINEPSAAALYHRYSTQNGDGQMMIVDFGGGTLDVSIVDCFENIIEITTIAGDNRLGGNDIDRAIAAHFCRENNLVEDQMEPSLRASLYRQVETAKIALSGSSEVVISLWQGEMQYSLVLTDELLRRLCEPIFQKVRTVITRAMKDRDQRGRINDVILVGGSSQLTVFGDFLEELFGRRPHVAANPDEIVALGVGICAGIKERAEDLQDLVMTDVCPFSLGVATYNYAGDKTPHMSVLIPRSSMLPASHQERFYTLHNNQNGLRFEIYQGEGYFASENLKLGELEVRVPPGLAGKQSALVTFTYDIDGILHVSAKSSGGDYRDTLILNSGLHLTEEEQAKAMERIQQIRLAAQGSQKDQLLLERGLRLYEQTIGQRREMAAELIGYWKQLMDQGDWISRERNYEWVRERLDWLEAQNEADPLDNGFWYGEPEGDGDESEDEEE